MIATAFRSGIRPRKSTRFPIGSCTVFSTTISGRTRRSSPITRSTQTGSIALLAFVFADYAVRLLPGDRAGDTSALGSIVAAMVVVVLTLVNLAGLRPGRRAQYVLTAAEVGGL